MPLQSDNLIMVGLGVHEDDPPHAIQPTLPDGVHLRWQPDPELGFPWHGYFLFRRPHNDGTPICISANFDPTWPTGVPGSLQLPGGQFVSDAPIVLTEGFASPAAREFDLSGRTLLRFNLKPGRFARRFLVTIGFGTRGVADPKGDDPGDEDRKDEDRKDEDRKDEDRKDEDRKDEDRKDEDRKDEDRKDEDRKDEDRKDEGSRPEEPVKVEPAGCFGGFLRPIVHAIQSLTGWGIGGGGQGAGQGPGPGSGQVGPPVIIIAYDDGVLAAMTSASAPMGQTVTVSLEADRMDAVRIEGGTQAVLIDICYVPVDQDWNAGWGEVPGFTYPMCLPTAATGYPCPGRPISDAAAEALALQRIRYGLSSAWNGAPVQELREAMDGMTVFGPPGGPMAERTGSYTDHWQDPDAPTMPDQRPLDLIMLGAINPAIAQMAGLYYIDDPEAPVPGPSVGAYDYLLLADHTGLYQGQASMALAALANPLPADVDGWICFGLRKQTATPLPVPTEVKVFALSGAATDPALIAADKVHAAGLHWKLEQNADGDLLPDAHVGFHVWRAGPIAEPSAAVAEADHTHITLNHMVMVASPEDGLAVQQYASDWPQTPLHKVDAGLLEGWYTYIVRGMDIFGRISGPSAPAPWCQWGPEPNPRPWYYTDPAVDAEVNPWAVSLLCKTPPPAVPGVQAWTLDPLDPGLADTVGNVIGVYDAWAALGWWSNLPAADKPRKAGLRVRWRWDAEQMLAAPRTREFRIYVSPGSSPVAGYDNPLNWPSRVFVVDCASNFTNVVDPSTNTVLGRQYEVLLPRDAGSSDFPDLIMEPTDADPVVYANVAVTAADDRTHTADDTKWTSGLWGGLLRFGNEGPIGATAKISRVLRSPPPTPPLIGDDDKVRATRADYHGRSFYTVHWVKPPGAKQKVHIYQAVDDALFRFDWERRQEAGAHAFTTADVDPFAVAAGWNNAGDKTFVVDQLTGLDAVKALDFDTDPAVRAAYEGLKERALRVLASLPDNADAFVQTTWEPLDPADAANTDRAGPDGAPGYTPDTNWGAWLAELDGYAANRYFFRYAYVNSAHDRGLLGPSTPAVYLPKVAAPRRPAITRVQSGQLEITVTWAHNREPDFTEFRLYRADDERQARDRRLMKRVATVARADVDYALPEVSFTDTDGLVGGKTYRFVLTSVDTEGNESLPSGAAEAMGVDDQIPPAPTWTQLVWLLRNDGDGSVAVWPDDGVMPAGTTPIVRLGWTSDVLEPWFVVARRITGDAGWNQVMAGAANEFEEAPVGNFSWTDTTANPNEPYEYALRVRAGPGVWSSPDSTLVVPPVPVVDP